MKEDAFSPIKFLLVDDLEDNLVALEALLRRPGLEVLLARSGREALELLLEHDVALALVDVQMPEMDGFELAELMRGAERTKTVPIIFITAGTREQNRIFKGYDAGAVDFLFKPVDAHILRHKTDTFFQLHRQKQQLKAQLALLQESEQLRTRMIESSHDAIALVDLQGKVASLKASGTSRLTPDQMERLMGCEWISLWQVAHREDAAAAFAAALAGGVGRFVGSGQHPASAGQWWDVAMTPILDASGKVEKVLSVSRDVTEQRRSQAELEKLTNELRETLRLNETFVAAVTHDLRNPLGAILTTAEVMARRANDPMMKRSSERVVSSGRRMAAMIDALFDLARARLSGGIPIHRVSTNLLPLARKVLSEFQATSPDRSFELDSEGELLGSWDGDRIEQVLSNLLANAVRHGASEGPVRVALDGRSPQGVIMQVINPGEIDAAILPFIFDPFRTGRERKQRDGGLGLGLYIVQQIVNGHGGNVEVRSDGERGTSFQIWLPRRDIEETAVSA